MQDSQLLDRGLRNYWGYNSIGFFAPHNAYAATGQTGEQVQEFKAMVRDLHEAGIEVILDVVYNHTAEGNHLGPMLSFRGIDNAAYYRLVPEDKRFYFDTTGTGNSLNVAHPHTLQLIMDSLRYWVTEMHVDGFRFDLAATLARQFYEVDRLSAFFDLIQQDPVVSQVKLIAEPWDVGEGGYQVGNFPPIWAEWNGKYRDTVRDLWRGEPAAVGEFASRLTGSSDLYQADTPPPDRQHQLRHRPRRLHAARPGLLQRQAQRGQRRGQRRRREPQPLLELRQRGPHRRRGGQRAAPPPPARLPGHAAAVPGRADAAGRRRAGPHPGRQQQRLLRRTTRPPGSTGRTSTPACWSSRARSSRSAASHPVFRRRHWFHGRPIRGIADITWYGPDGTEMSDEDWERPEVGAIGFYLNGDAIPGRDRRGQHITDDSFLVLINAHHQPLDWTLPDGLCDGWQLLVDTARDDVVTDPGARGRRQAAGRRRARDGRADVPPGCVAQEQSEAADCAACSRPRSSSAAAVTWPC